MTTFKSTFVQIRIALFVVAVAVVQMNMKYVGAQGSYLPNLTVGLLSFGLTIAGGMALIAAAIEGRPRD
jgi:hypothetical protein